MAGGGGPSRVTQVNQPPEYLQQYINQLMPYMGQIGSGTLTPGIPPNYPLVAPIHPLTNMGNAYSANYLMGPQMQGGINQMFGGLNTLYGGFDPRFNPLFNATAPHAEAFGNALMSAVGRGGGAGSGYMSLNGGGGELAPQNNEEIQALIDASSDDMVRAFERGELSNLRASAVDNGVLGGSRQGIAQGVAEEGLGRALLTMSSGIRSNAYESERNRQAQLAASNISANAQMGSSAAQAQSAALDTMGRYLGQGQQQGFMGVNQALSLAPNILNYPASVGQQLAGMGGAYQQNYQQYLDANLNRLMHNGSLTAQDLQLFSGLVNGTNPGAFGSSQQSSRGPSTNPWMGAVGGAATGAGLATTMGLMSGPWGWVVIGLGALAGAMG